MSNAIAKSDTVRNLPSVANDKPDPLQMLGVAIEKGMSVSDLGPLMDLVERDQANKARTAFTAAMSEFQAKCPTIRKTGKGDRYNYAPLDEIIWTIRPVLDECGLSVRFDSETAADTVTAICYVSHRDGHTEKSQFTAPIDRAVSKAGNALMNSTQQVGSANSYAKRYALCNALNLVGSEFDDDGYSAGKPTNPDDEPASEEQHAYINEFREAGTIPDVTLKWLDKQENLTFGQAKSLLVKLRKAGK